MCSQDPRAGFNGSCFAVEEGRENDREKEKWKKNAPSPTIYPVYGLDIKARQVEDWQKFNQISLTRRSSSEAMASITEVTHSTKCRTL